MLLTNITLDLNRLMPTVLIPTDWQPDGDFSSEIARLYAQLHRGGVGSIDNVFDYDSNDGLITFNIKYDNSNNSIRSIIDKMYAALAAYFIILDCTDR